MAAAAAAANSFQLLKIDNDWVIKLKGAPTWIVAAAVEEEKEGEGSILICK